LDEVLPARGRAPMTFAPPEARFDGARRNNGAGGCGGGGQEAQAADDWDDGGLDAGPPRPGGHMPQAQMRGNGGDGGGGDFGRGPMGRSQISQREAANDWTSDDVLVPPRRGIGGSGGGPPSTAGDADSDTPESVMWQANDAAARPSPSFGGRPPSSGPARGRGGGAGGGVASTTGSRGRLSAPQEDNGWSGQSLADAFTPKKAAPQSCGGSSASGAGRRGPPSRAGGAVQGGVSTSPSAGFQGGAAPSGKTTDEIVAWVKSLPDSHVPEKSRNNIIAVVEEGNFSGREFSDYVQQVPPEVCAPKNAMKLKAAWKNVLNESVASEAATANYVNQAKQKATMIVV